FGFLRGLMGFPCSFSLAAALALASVLALTAGITGLATALALALVLAGALVSSYLAFLGFLSSLLFLFGFLGWLLRRFLCERSSCKQPTHGSRGKCSSGGHGQLRSLRHKFASPSIVCDTGSELLRLW